LLKLDPEDAQAIACLADGAAGASIFYHYLADVLPNRGYAAAAGEMLGIAARVLSTSAMSPSLYAGLTGIAWAVAHLQRRGLKVVSETDLRQIDSALLSYMACLEWEGHFDLISGLVGLGVYGLERYPSPAGGLLVEQVVARLDGTAEHRDDESTWFTPSHHLHVTARRQYPRGWYDLGIAHGVPGVIAFLSAACAVGANRPRTEWLLKRAVRWLLRQQLSEEFGSCFASCTSQDVAPTSSRAAWCYGDPGIATALLGAARCLRDSACAQAALKVAHSGARRRLDDAGIVDMGICHGAAGLGHLFNRIYQATREDEFGSAARFWILHALDMWREKISSESNGASVDTANAKVLHGFLEGSCGVGLALLGAVSYAEPAWDTVLLSSLPPSSLVDVKGNSVQCEISD